MSELRHFIAEHDLSSDEFRQLIERGSEFRKQHKAGTSEALLPRRTLGMIFAKSSTRTRISLETAMVQLGGSAINLSPNDTQMGRGEPMEDMARVLSEMVDIISVRTYSHDSLLRFRDYCSVPVINALTDLLHPCQMLADMQTWFDHRGDMQGKTVAWIGDGNNMCNSYINTASLLGFTVRIACPAGYEPDANIIDAAGSCVIRTTRPEEACEGVDLVVTDVWASMGQENEQAKRAEAFADYRVSQALMQLASDDALFLHCLPAHRGEEVDAEVIDGAQSVVWEEAGNRLHAQKALIEFLLQRR